MSSVPFIILSDLILRFALKSLSPVNLKKIYKIYSVIFLLLITLVNLVEIDGLQILNSFLRNDLGSIETFAILLIFVRVFTSKSESEEVLSLASLLLLGANSIFLCLLVVGALLVWQFNEYKKISKILLIFCLSSLALSTISVLYPYIYIFTGLVLLYSFGKNKISSENVLSSIIFVTVALSEIVFKLPSINIFVCLFLLPLSKIFINLIKLQIRAQDEKQLFSVAILFFLTTLVSLLGLKELFFLNLAFLLLMSMLMNSRYANKNNYIWYLSTLLLVFSPPFGLGYIVKTNLIEVALYKDLYWALLLIPFYLAVQLLFFTDCFKRIKTDLPLIKSKELRYDNLGLAFIAVIFLISLLFLPKEWSSLFGESFKTLVNAEIYNEIGIGYYLFWVELGFWTIGFFIYQKVLVGTFDKFLFNLHLNKLEKYPITPIEIKDKIQKPIFFKTFVSSFNNMGEAFVECVMPHSVLIILVLILLSVL